MTALEQAEDALELAQRALAAIVNNCRQAEEVLSAVEADTITDTEAIALLFELNNDDSTAEADGLCMAAYPKIMHALIAIDRAKRRGG